MGWSCRDRYLERSPGLKAHASTETECDGEWAVEPAQELWVDKGMHTTFFLSTDGKGNTLSPARKDKIGRLRRRHKRFTMHDKRDSG